MESADSVWVGIEVTRQLRVVDGGLAPAGDLQAGGVNLLEHQIKIALQIAPPDRVCVLSPQGDERVLELIAQYEVRELAPFDFIAMLSERAKAGEEGAVVLLRQIAPLESANMLKQALKLLKKHPVVISASKPPEGHKRHQPLPGQSEPDYRCLAFEMRRISEFGAAGAAGEEELQFIDWDSFAEFTGRDDAEAGARVRGWE